MSWSFNLTSESKDALKAEIEKQEYCPPQLRELLVQSVGEVNISASVGTNLAIHVESTGHHDPAYTSYGSWKVERVTKI